MRDDIAICETIEIWHLFFSRSLFVLFSYSLSCCIIIDLYTLPTEHVQLIFDMVHVLPIYVFFSLCRFFLSLLSLISEELLFDTILEHAEQS